MQFRSPARLPLARLIAAATATVPALAPAQSVPLPFVPHLYAGVEAGRVARGADRGAHRDTAVAYGAFAGVELPSIPLGYLAVEGGVGRSEGTVTTLSGTGASAALLRTDPDWNWSATARLGLNPVPGLAAYGIAGYGAEKVDVARTPSPAGPVVDRARRNLDGLLYGVGARYTFGRSLGARLEYRRRLTDGRYDPEQVMGGVYFRL